MNYGTDTKLIEEPRNMCLFCWIYIQVFLFYIDIIPWKQFPDYSPFVRGIHQSPVDFATEGPVMQILNVSINVSLYKLIDNNWVAGDLRCPAVQLMWHHYNVCIFCRIYSGVSIPNGTVPLIPRVRGFWSWFGGVCSLTYCNGNFRVTMVSEPFNVIL